MLNFVMRRRRDTSGTASFDVHCVEIPECAWPWVTGEIDRNEKYRINRRCTK